mmetsp:Transcript_10691/g.35176  ORF Transcript_10691/g.35176 Transcript_10691/m.35176 type:complete len:153 (-) Transcript_10691:55-513(-)
MSEKAEEARRADESSEEAGAATEEEAAEEGDEELARMRRELAEGDSAELVVARMQREDARREEAARRRREALEAYRRMPEAQRSAERWGRRNPAATDFLRRERQPRGAGDDNPFERWMAVEQQWRKELFSRALRVIDETSDLPDEEDYLAEM